MYYIHHLKHGILKRTHDGFTTNLQDAAKWKTYDGATNHLTLLQSSNSDWTNAKIEAGIEDPPFYDCACYLDCQADSHSGQWHTHEGEPCPVHPEAVMVG